MDWQKFLRRATLVNKMLSASRKRDIEVIRPRWRNLLRNHLGKQRCIRDIADSNWLNWKLPYGRPANRTLIRYFATRVLVWHRMRHYPKDEAMPNRLNLFIRSCGINLEFTLAKNCPVAAISHVPCKNGITEYTGFHWPDYVQRKKLLFRRGGCCGLLETKDSPGFLELNTYVLR